VTHRNLVALLRDRDEEAITRVVPASPAWTVKDVVGHVTGVAADATGGREFADLNLLDAWRDPGQAARRDALTAAQVDSRRSLSLAEVLEEWAGHCEALVPMLRGDRPFPVPMPFIDSIVVADLAVHAQDVRGALGLPGDRESAGVGIAMAGYAAALGLRLRALGLPALRLSYGGKERIVGHGEPAATIEAERYEIFRALAGRRSTEQIMAMRWTGDPELYLPVIPAYGERTDAIEE